MKIYYCVLNKHAMKQRRYINSNRKANTLCTSTGWQSHDNSVADTEVLPI
jgi:hypothetical protein